MLSQDNILYLRAVLTSIHGLDPESFLVGGIIRDALMGRAREADVDVAVKSDGYRIAHAIAEAGPGRTFVPLDRQHGTGRLVVKEPYAATIDISSFKGLDIIQDLRKRDFTINALAVRIEDYLVTGLSHILDPTGGVADLNSRVVRACSAEAFHDDPLRILRTFRFQARLGFEVAQQTLELISKTVPDLQRVAGERIRDELISILSSDRAYPALLGMDGHGVLDVLFPELVPLRWTEQNVYHHLDVWGHTLETVRQLELLLADHAAYFEEFAAQVDSYVRQEHVKERPVRALLKLAALFHDAGKPSCMSRDPDGRIRFFGHEKVSREIFEAVGERLKLATREVRTIAEWIGGHMRLMISEGETLSKRALLRLRRKFESDAVGLMVLFLADLAASRGPARTDEAFDHAFKQVSLALEFLLESSQAVAPALLNGTDLMRILGICPGPLVGRLLARLRELQDAGEIVTREQAATAARQLFQQVGNGDASGPD